ncbi:MAG: fadD4 1, partial [Ilumatobacteraceae bacterium]|nr:fadD4 1 [Ilumatobacteraceae bacterium]
MTGWDQRLGVWWIAEDHADLPAVLESPSGVKLTFGELAGRAHQIVHALRAQGLRAGDVVAYALPNGVDVVWWQLALQESGMRGISLNPSLSAREVRAIVDHAGADCIVIDSQHADLAFDLQSAPSLRLKVSVGGPIDDHLGFAELVAGHPTSLPEHRCFGAPIVYSSGTTGAPKAIDRHVPGADDPSARADSAKLFARAFQFEPLSGVHLVSAGMHHGGCQSFYQGALNVGHALVILGKFDPEQTLAAIERHHVTTAYMVPTQFVRMLRLPDDVKRQHDLSSLRVVVHSAAPCPVTIKQQMMDWWGPVIWETYGGMEGAATIAKPARWLERPGTVGRAVRGMTVKILDDDGGECAADVVGNVFLEPVEPTFTYRGDAVLTASVHRGRAFTLGDVGSLDADGYLFLRDRAKDMIISGGVNIYPAEAEAVLIGHPAVADVAVIGIPDDEWGETVHAVVEVAPGFQPGDA